tara:strand:- start:1704 stop:2930 length:1227 start_codon:yes stop_codon:yes gene_type:complete
MNNYNISFIKSPSNIEINLNSSKSESNRLLIIKSLSDDNIKLSNLSKANDTILLNKLIKLNSNSIWDAEDAGTTMRFLTSYLALQKEKVILTGTERMKKRPIKILVDALEEIGAKIEYQEKKGYPPLIINKKISQNKNSISIRGDISSQYISSLLMIAPILKNGLIIKIISPFYSKPYVMMTLNLMKKFGINYEISKDSISIKNQKYKEASYKVESDWSAASYWYSFLSINKMFKEIRLIGLRKDSFQGDQIIKKIMSLFNVETHYNEDGVILRKKDLSFDYLELDFKDCPDLAQTILVIAAFHKTKLKLYGVESLKIKETDRLLAMKIELNKIGVNFFDDNGIWTLERRNKPFPNKVSIDTYEDHRMAMAFAPLATELDLTINNPGVVNKSYPSYWDDMKKAGYKII